MDGREETKGGMKARFLIGLDIVFALGTDCARGGPYFLIRAGILQG